METTLNPLEERREAIRTWTRAAGFLSQSTHEAIAESDPDAPVGVVAKLVLKKLDRDTKATILLQEILRSVAIVLKRRRVTAETSQLAFPWFATAPKGTFEVKGRDYSFDKLCRTNLQAALTQMRNVPRKSKAIDSVEAMLELMESERYRHRRGITAGEVMAEENARQMKTAAAASA